MSLKLDFFHAPLYSCYDISSKTESIGHNKNGVVIICQSFNNPEIADFLKKILAAVQTDLLEHCIILDINLNKNIAWSELIRNYKHEKVIIFGLEPNQLGLHIKITKYKLLEWNGTKILYSDSLDNILIDKNKKAFLWRELQLMFQKF